MQPLSQGSAGTSLPSTAAVTADDLCPPASSRLHSRRDGKASLAHGQGGRTKIGGSPISEVVKNSAPAEGRRIFSQALSPGKSSRDRPGRVFDRPTGEDRRLRPNFWPAGSSVVSAAQVRFELPEVPAAVVAVRAGNAGRHARLIRRRLGGFQLLPCRCWGFLRLRVCRSTIASAPSVSDYV